MHIHARYGAPAVTQTVVKARIKRYEPDMTNSWLEYGHFRLEDTIRR
jgi:hypothetical protein